MAKAKISKPVLYLVLAAACVAVYLVMTPQDAVKKRPRPKPSVKVDVTNAQFTPDDYTASFPGLVAVSRNSFKPLVVRRNNSLVSALAAAGGVPADFAGGDGNWVCTGVAEVDGVKQALLENKSNGEGVFLRQGDRWKKAVVSQVFEDAVVLVGPGGVARTIHVQQDQMVEDISTVSTENLPVQPRLSGPIGGGQPNPGASGIVTPTSEAPAAPPLPIPTTDE